MFEIDIANTAEIANTYISFDLSHMLSHQFECTQFRWL